MKWFLSEAASWADDMPTLAERDFFVYTYFAAGFDNTLVAHLVGMSSAQDGIFYVPIILDPDDLVFTDE